MNKTNLKKFKKLFEEEKSKILFNDKILRDDFSVNQDDRMDEVDQASSDMEQSMRMRLCNREALYLKKVDQALKRIEDNTFGLCTECDEEIELKRLLARPTANLCVSCKEEQELKELQNASGHVHKSLGQAFSKKYA